MSDNWEMYFTNVDDAPAAMLVDMGAAENAPDPERPVLLWMWLNLKSPNEDGFADDTEEPRLVEIEDAFIDAVELTGDAILVGRITTCGRREFYFYAKSSVGFGDSIAESMQAFEEYEFETGEEVDEEWSHYTNVLFPDPENMQEIFNNHVIEELSEAGDSLTTTRLVDHHASFADDASLASFVTAAEAEGFQKLSDEMSEDPDDELPHGVTLQREHAVDWDTIDEVTFVLFSLAGEHEGQYAGWSSPVVTD